MIFVICGCVGLVRTTDFLLTEDGLLAIGRNVGLMVLFVDLNRFVSTEVLWNSRADWLGSGS